MNLNTLIEKIQTLQDIKEVRKLVKRESDINICLNLLAELKKRARLVLEHTQKAVKYEADVKEYLDTLAKKGITIPDDTGTGPSSQPRGR